MVMHIFSIFIYFKIRMTCGFKHKWEGASTWYGMKEYLHHDTQESYEQQELGDLDYLLK